MNMNLKQLVDATGVSEQEIRDYVSAGLLPNTKQLTAETTFTDRDRYWMDMVQCFYTSGTSLADLKELMPHCQAGQSAADLSLG